MNRETGYGNSNPNAPPELSQLAFIISARSLSARG
jgi:hypothetical protein